MATRAIDQFLNVVDTLPGLTVIEPSTYCNLIIQNGHISSGIQSCGKVYRTKTRDDPPDDEPELIVDCKPCYQHSSPPSSVLNDLLTNQGYQLNLDRLGEGYDRFDFKPIKQLNITFSHPGRQDCIYFYTLANDTITAFHASHHCPECDAILGNPSIPPSQPVKVPDIPIPLGLLRRPQARIECRIIGGIGNKN
jgi:hypothetical protein